MLMWESLLTGHGNYVVVFDDYDFTSVVKDALYVDQRLFTIVLDRNREAQRSTSIGDLQVVHNVEEAVFYRNYESKDHNGWVLFLSSDYGLIQSISSVATIVEKPEWILLENRLSLLYDNDRIGGFLEVAKTSTTGEENLWKAIADKPEKLLENLGILDYSEKVVEYNKSYRDKIKEIVGNEEAFETLTLDLDHSNSEWLKGAISRIRDTSVGEINLDEAITHLFSNDGDRAFLYDLNLPERYPGKIQLQVIPSSKDVVKIDGCWFVNGENLSLQVQSRNTSCSLNYDFNDQFSNSIELEEGLTNSISCPPDFYKVSLRAKRSGVEPFSLSLLSICAPNAGIYNHQGLKLRETISGQMGATRVELSVDSFGPASKFYVIHTEEDQVNVEGGRSSSVLDSGGYCLTTLFGFDGEVDEVVVTIGEVDFVIPNYDIESATSISVSSSIIRQQKEALFTKGKRVYSSRNRHPLHDQERSLLCREKATFILIGDDVENTVFDERGFLYSQDLEEGIISSRGNVSFGDELLGLWETVRRHFLHETKGFELSLLHRSLQTIEEDLVFDFYEAFVKECKSNVKASQFLTVNFLAGNDVRVLALPIYHPIVLHDLFRYFQNYKVDESRIHLNAGYSLQCLKSIHVFNETFYAIDGIDTASYVFQLEISRLDPLVEKRLQPSELTRPLQNFLPLASNQVQRAVRAMFDYLGYKRSFKILLRIDCHSELKTFTSNLIKGFGEQMERVSIDLFVENEIFDNLSGYYASGIDNVRIRRSSPESEQDYPNFDLIIDTRQQTQPLIDFREDERSGRSSYSAFGFNVPSYKFSEKNLEAVYTYPEDFVAHRLVSSAKENLILHVAHVRENLNEELMSQGQIVCMQLAKFNSMRNQVDHVVFEMKANNRTSDLAASQSSFVIAIRNTNQLKNRIRENISTSLGTENNLKQIRETLLKCNLFSFNQILGNQNKMQGTLGELCIYFQLQNELNFQGKGFNVFVIPFDHVSLELKQYFAYFQSAQWSQYPDFLVLDVERESLRLTLVEVKTRRECSYPQIYNDQLLPLKNVFDTWNACDEVDWHERKRLMIFLVQFVLETNGGLISAEVRSSFQNWLNNPAAEVAQENPIIFHLGTDQDASQGTHFEAEYTVVRGVYGAEIQSLTHSQLSYCGHAVAEILHSRRADTQDSAKLAEIYKLDKEVNGDGEIQAEQGKFQPYLNPYNVSLRTKKSEIVNRVADPEEALHQELADVLLDKYRLEYVNTRRWFSRQRIELKEAEPEVLLSPMAVRFYYVLSERNKLKQITALEADLALQLKIEEGGSINVFGDKGKVVIEIPLSDWERQFFKFTSLSSQSIDKDQSVLEVPIGVDMYGDVLTFAFGDNSPHLLIAGTTGSGKSVALEVIIGGFLTRYDSEQIQFVIVDPKQTELIDFELFDGVKNNCLGEPIGSTPRDACRILSLALDEMTRRLDLFASTSKTLRSQGQRSIKNIDQYNSRGDARLPRLVVVLDEYADLVSIEDDKKEIEALLVQLAQKSRSAGIHLMVATQKPIVEVLSTVVKGNLPAVLALRVNSQSDSRVVLDEGGAERLLGKGDALLKIGGQTRRLQIAQFDQWP